MAHEARTFCRICQGMCGLVATIEDGRVVKVRGDRDNALSRGFACSKGLASPELHYGPKRLLHHQRKRADGTHQRIGFDDAIDLVSDRLRPIVARHGPGAVAAYVGTQATCNSIYRPLAIDFLRALGSPSLFSSMTIDQSAKWVTIGRMGIYLAGRQPLKGADVWMLCGVNPMVSMSGWSGNLPAYDPVKIIKEARREGLTLIVIDPVRTQTAEHADLFLQPLPGHDAAIFAAILNIVLSEGWHDASFCADYADGLEALAAAVAPFTEAMVEQRADLPPGQLRRAAEMFARDGRRGCAGGGTGPNMAAHSNLAEHLIEALNVVCGRFCRAGEPVPRLPVLHPDRPVRAEARGPKRTWETGHKGVTGIGTMFGQMMTATLADEILHDGPGGIRALFCVGSNPANALPDQRHAVKALGALDLLVTSDVVWSETAQLADIVFAVKQPFERPDHTHFLESLGFELPFAQYTPALVDPPEDSDVVDDWLVYFALAQRLGLALELGGPLDMSTVPDNDALLERLVAGSAIPYEAVKASPSGAVFDREAPLVQPPRPGKAGRLDLAPADVLAEIAALLAEAQPDEGATHLLVCRRERETMNSFGRELAPTRRRFPRNPAWLNGADIAALGLHDGDRARIVAGHDAIETELRADPAVRPGVISMSHGWGGLPDRGDPECDGASTTRLVSRDRAIESINAMPRLSGIPVRIEPI
ncbi:molybdopterin-dependent oxidoreductase [Sphingomonas sp. CGMCC 1.13654]|uniref:Molybdopterin-dependent oxidoreductase n=1 Tax=Sphingomonas chungangi TaxID=2683589 RepID=A0A838L595_9SPHN|nr:molybdopterin-dependent oxidoreductase [Sphingomonas chungangi]MBA2933772.1 molybdopterin-dependent oxidoreductase [Sphingomonas chungangi]MVW55103.1 molybdopterin-dependent oxidoreductase [Sphingomonas chungangi]